MIDAKADIRAYNSKIAWLRARTVVLEYERDLFQQHLSSLKQVLTRSPIRTLPVELMTEIFSQYCDRTTLEIVDLNPGNRKNGGHDGPHLKIDVPAAWLGRGCRVWRNITLSTPCLWSTISLNL